MFIDSDDVTSEEEREGERQGGPPNFKTEVRGDQRACQTHGCT